MLTADRLPPHRALNPVDSGDMLVPNHAVYAAGTSFCPLAVFVSTTTENLNVALPEVYPSAGRSRASHRLLPVCVASTANPTPVPQIKPPAGSFCGASEPWLITKEDEYVGVITVEGGLAVTNALVPVRRNGVTTLPMLLLSVNVSVSASVTVTAPVKEVKRIVSPSPLA